jgi:hypothetical protein
MYLVLMIGNKFNFLTGIYFLSGYLIVFSYVSFNTVFFFFVHFSSTFSPVDSIWDAVSHSFPLNESCISFSFIFIKLIFFYTCVSLFLFMKNLITPISKWWPQPISSPLLIQTSKRDFLQLSRYTYMIYLIVHLIFNNRWHPRSVC